jgi:hypothetical protein
MYSPVIIDDSDKGKPVYEQSIHNQRLCVQCRFPLFEDMFVYDEGIIVGVRKNFKIPETDLYGIGTEFFRWYITQLASTSEKSNVARIIDPDDFINSIKTATLTSGAYET